MARPAITASTPDSNIANQIPTPTRTAAGPRHEPAQRSAMSTPNSPIATASAVDRDVLGVAERDDQQRDEVVDHHDA